MFNQKQAVKDFVTRWTSEEGNEDRQSRSFWIELAQNVLGISDPTYVLDFERKVKGRKIDVFYEDMGILIEQKSRGVDLDKSSERSKKAGEETPYQQAKWYADNLPYSLRPRWIIVCNFDEFRIHDLELDYPETEYVSFTLSELPDQLHLLSFFTDKSASRLVKEKELSVQAGEIVGRLYKSLAGQYKNIETDKAEQRSLNILIVRFVFLLYAEDAGILQEHQAFLNYMKGIAPEDMRRALIELFEVLDTPEDKRNPYLNEKLLAFPYINGSLFAEQDIIIPQFTQQIKFDLLKEASQEFDWSGISPTIFGAAFESTLNPDTRREGGMHYTSIENIHKVIDPLFLDDLRAELTQIEGEKVAKNRRTMLKAFQNKLASLKIFDPACGSGNFLTESFLSLRKLENRVLENLIGEQGTLGFEEEFNPIKVSISQFYGIEINDFAVAVAKTALWIAEEQMMDITQGIVLMPLDFLPLTSNDNIHEGNALRMDWNQVVPAEECSYIIGNPPFIGYSNHNKEQQEDRALYFGKCKVVDYVANWYIKAADYMEASKQISAALVSTNSIVQGQQVEPLWKPLFDRGVHINFAWEPFVWNNEASDQAHVHVVIVGFSYTPWSRKFLFDNKEEKREVSNINGYLKDAANVFIAKQMKPLSSAPEMIRGCQPTDGGNLLFKNEKELEDLLKNEPGAQKWIRPFSMGGDLIKGNTRFCLWMPNAAELDFMDYPLVRERIEKVRVLRLASAKAATQKKAATPWRFDEVKETGDTFIAIPVVSSERRDYIPIAFVTDGMIPGNKLFFIPTDSLFIFGILMSQFHNAWMRTVAGRLKSDYSYANTIVYNNFIYPNPSPEQKEAIETLAQSILDIRDSYPSKSLADLYDPDKMPSELLAAHKTLDKAVEEAYGVDFKGDEEKIVAHLFKLYAAATQS